MRISTTNMYQAPITCWVYKRIVSVSTDSQVLKLTSNKLNWVTIILELSLKPWNFWRLIWEVCRLIQHFYVFNRPSFSSIIKTNQPFSPRPCAPAEGQEQSQAHLYVDCILSHLPCSVMALWSGCSPSRRFSELSAEDSRLVPLHTLVLGSNSHIVPPFVHLSVSIPSPYM